MIEKGKITLKSLNHKIDILGLEFDDKFDHLEKRMDGRMLLIAEKVDILAREVNERMERFDESNQKNGVLLENLDSKFDFALEGYGSLKELVILMNERLNVLENRV